MKRLASRSFSILTGCIIALAILVSGPRIVGIQTYAVISGSMEPVLPVGSLIYTKKCAVSEIKEGDIITYKLRDSHATVTHRVTKTDGKTKLITKGDANDSEDPCPIYEEMVRGKVIFHIPFLGLIVMGLQNKK